MKGVWIGLVFAAVAVVYGYHLAREKTNRVIPIAAKLATSSPDPPFSGCKPLDPPGYIAVVVQGHSDFVITDEHFSSPEELGQNLKARMEYRPKVVWLKAWPDVKFHDVGLVADAIRTAGASEIRLMTEQVEAHACATR